MWSGEGTKAGLVRFVAPGAPLTRVLDTTLDSQGLMTWHEAAPAAEERLPADWLKFLVFGLLCRHTASNSITSKTHTSGAQ